MERNQHILQKLGVPVQICSKITSSFDMCVYVYSAESAVPLDVSFASRAKIRIESKLPRIHGIFTYLKRP